MCLIKKVLARRRKERMRKEEKSLVTRGRKVGEKKMISNNHYHNCDWKARRANFRGKKKDDFLEGNEMAKKS